MTQMVIWMLGIAFSAGAMVVTTSTEAYVGQFALATVIVAFITISGIRDHNAAAAEGQHPSLQSATIARHMGLLWAWAAVSVVLIYSLVITAWTAWFASFLILVMGAAVCMFLANILVRDAAQDEVDSRVVTMVHWIARLQFGATCLAIGGLIAIGKFSASAFGGEAKWAAVNVMLCMAIGLAGLSGYAIAQDSSAAPLELEPETPKATVKRISRGSSVSA